VELQWCSQINFFRAKLVGEVVMATEETFKYAVVEQTLMAIHGFTELRRGAFRARLIHFQRLQIISKAPGKGRRIAYRKEDIFRWAIALEFAEFGIEPTEIKKILDPDWTRIADAIFGLNGDRDKFLFFYPNLLGRLSRESDHETPNQPGAPYRIVIEIISDLAELSQNAHTDAAHDFVDRCRARYGMINLTRLRGQVEASLVASSPVPG
jgi:hypothetical protein